MNTIPLGYFDFCDVWFNLGVGDDLFLKCFNKRIRHVFSKEWHCRLHNNIRADVDRVYKNSFATSNYIELLPNKQFREALCRFLTSSHCLRVESGRWQRNPNIPRDQRFCFNCPSKIEDEYHFVLECSLYNDIRLQLIPRYFRTRPSMYKFIQLLNSNKKKQMLCPAKYIYKCFKLRSEAITNTDQ